MAKTDSETEKLSTIKTASETEKLSTAKTDSQAKGFSPTEESSTAKDYPSTEAEIKYKDIIHRSWPADPSIYRKHPKMSLQDRAKIFAPFAALRGHSDRLFEETGRLLRTTRAALSEEESAILSGKLLQVRKGMKVTVLYFEPDSSDEETGYYISLTGTVSELDTIFHSIKINTGEMTEKGELQQSIRFDDLMDIRLHPVSDDSSLS
ncbi:MAG: hypothetical protein LUG93_02590 [Lachnospiraceae bacterium]|nr:hypothetical protein [Lachnospiraceae bacterium]